MQSLTRQRFGFGGFVFPEKKEDLICIVADSLMSKVEGKSETLASRLWVNLDPPSFVIT